mgnify:CR=1 FL=1
MADERAPHRQLEKPFYVRGDADLIAGLERAARAAPEIAKRALEHEAAGQAGEMSDRVPFETGALEATTRVGQAYVEKDGDIAVRYGSGGDLPYAMIQYWYPHYEHQHPQEDQWVWRQAKRSRRRMLKNLAASFRWPR